MTVRQYGMVQCTRREDSALDEAKLEADVGVTRLRDEARMAFGVHTGLVHPRVQGGVVDVMDLLSRGQTMVQFDGIGTTPTGVTWVERVDEFKAMHERLDVRRGFFEASPVAFPHFHHVVPSVLKLFDFVLGCLVDIMPGPITVTHMFFVMVGIMAGTPVDETAMKFVHRVGVLTVAIHEELRTGDVILAGIAGVLNVLAMTGMWVVRVSAGHEIVIVQVFGVE